VSAFPARSGARRRALIVLNRGIGNRVMSAPLFAYLGDKVDFAIIGSPMPASLLRDADPGTATLPYELPPLWRRFRLEDHAAILSFLTGKGLDLLINLRKEDPALDGGYFNFREMATAAGVECWDLHELGPECHALPFVRQCRILFARHLGPLPAPSQQWLAHTRSAPAEPSIGVFLGASVPVKRWTAESWRRSIHLISVARPDVRITVATGTEPAEQELLDEVMAGDSIGQARRVALPELDDLVRWIGGQCALVTGDTAAAHIVAAQGGFGVGLYWSTLAAAWAPDMPEQFVALQSPLGQVCPEMKVNGTCHRTYLNCPAPCRSGITPEQVGVAALRQLDRAGSAAAEAGIVFRQAR
jgi:ADP-heptose:LPS heptosyltransferase